MDLILKKIEQLSSRLVEIVSEINEGESLSKAATNKEIESLKSLSDIKSNISSLTAEKNVMTEQQSETIEKVDALTHTHDMHLIGSFNGWDAASTDFAMNESEDKATWSGFLTLDADAEIKVINHVDGLYYGTTDGANIALTAGTYCVKYTVADNSVVFQPLAYYVVGTFKDAEGKAVNFAVKDGVTPALTVADGKATADFTAVDVTAMNDYNWITAQGKPGVMAVKIVFGCELGIKDWYADPATEGDNFYLPAGEYTATFDIAAGTASVTQK